MRIRTLSTLMAIAVLTGATGLLKAQTTKPAKETTTRPSVDEIVEKTNYVSYYQGKTGKADVNMTIVDARKNKRSREFTIIRWDEPHPKAKKLSDKEIEKLPEKEQKEIEQHTGEQKFYVFFHRPADVDNWAFLVWKHMGKDDDRWLYMPQLDNLKRISAADKRTSFVGSHFLYEDVSGRNIDLDKHELVDETKDYYILKNTPKNKKYVDFAYYKMWIHKDSFVVVQTSYYDDQGKEYRRYNALGVKNIQGHPTVVKSRMTDLRDKSYTVMQYSDVKYDVPLKEEIFSERYLRRPPMQYLK
ncbi:MAG: outer membrane lipoprotein-sorting protein [Phycisphaerae bacterium]